MFFGGRGVYFILFFGFLCSLWGGVRVMNKPRTLSLLGKGTLPPSCALALFEAVFKSWR